MTDPLVGPVVVAQVGGATAVVAVIVLLVAAVTVARAVQVVDQGDPQALLVLGEYRRVLEPGVVIYPPFVSRTFPVDTETMTVDTGRGEIDVPEEDYPSLRAHGIDPDGEKRR